MLSFLKRYSIVSASIVFIILSLQIASSNIRGLDGSLVAGRFIILITTPFISTFNSVINATAAAWNDYLYLVNLKKENKALKSTIIRLNEENNVLKEKVYSADRIRDLLSFAENVPLSFKAANVIGVNNDGWLRIVTIDKGVRDGISKDMAVVSSKGIIGRVTEAYPALSKVMLITDPRSAVDVVIQRTRVRGIAEGKGDNKLILKYVEQSIDVQVGDAVVSSGIGGFFPKGILVGEVVKVEKGEDVFFKSIEIKTPVDFKKLEEVLIVTGNVG